MRLVSRELIQNQKKNAGVKTERVLTENDKNHVDYEQLAEILFEKIQNNPFSTQQEVMESIRNEGWAIEDIQIALSILLRRRRVVFVSDF